AQRVRRRGQQEETRDDKRGRYNEPASELSQGCPGVSSAPSRFCGIHRLGRHSPEERRSVVDASIPPGSRKAIGGSHNSLDISTAAAPPPAIVSTGLPPVP